jgi:hypothetical protein
MKQNFGLLKWHRALVLIAVLITILWQARTIKNTWRYAKAFEQEWVAASLLGGYGYSFDPVTAWLGPYGDGTSYNQTAWVEPLYTFVITIAFKIHLEYGRLILTLLNVVWLGLTGILILLLVGDILDHRVGLYTTILFLVLHATRIDIILYIGNATLAGFLYCLSAYLLFKCMKKPTISNGFLLGMTIGIANLNQSSSLLFAPLSVAMILISLGIRDKNAWRTSLILVTTTGILLAPWIVRNYIVFGTFVPVRSGFGLQLHMGNPALAHTFTPDLAFEAVESVSLWKAETPQQALQLLRNLEYNAALADYSINVVSKNSTAEYLSYNEVERDRVFLHRSLAFIQTEPLLALKMLVWKVIAFLSFGEFRLALIAIAAIIGSLLFIKDIRVASLTLLVTVYMLPYVLSLPLYYRYRSSIEPILFILSGLFLGVCLQKSTFLWNVFKEWISVHVTLRAQQPTR